MSNGIAIAALPRAPAYEAFSTLEPYLIEVIVPFDTGTVDEAVRLAAISAEGALEAAINALQSNAPTFLDVFAELAAAIGNDPNFATTMLTALATKLVKTANLSDLTDATAARGNLGLGRVDNTSDADKPVSTAQGEALATKASRAIKVSTSGLATGGGDLSADRTISVPKATVVQAKAGTDDATVITPALLAGVIAYTFTQPGVLANLLPTSLPAQAGVPWLNGSVVSIS